MRGLRRAYREAMATTTAYLGELFASTLTMKTAGAEERVVGRLREHNRRRNTAAIRDHVGRESLNAFNVATVEVAIGIMLLVAAPAMRRGEFTVGDLVLFTTYLDALSGLPRRIGRLLAYRRHASVAVERMQRLVDHEPDRLAEHRAMYLTAVDLGADASKRPCATSRPCCARLSVDGLTVRYPSSGRGVRGIDLSLAAGSVTVIAGEVGSGKTTLVRALLGLVPYDGGVIRWNGTEVHDPGSYLVPPRCAYVPQVPRLFSESLGPQRAARVARRRRDHQRRAPARRARRRRCRDAATRSTPSSDRVACACRAGSSSAPRPRARSCATPSSSWSTTPRARSTWRPRS